MDRDLQSTARTVIFVALSLVALVFLLVPESRPAGRFVLAPLYFTMGGDMLVQAWRSGHLQKSLSEIARNPPRTGAMETLANALGFIAMMVWLM